MRALLLLHRETGNRKCLEPLPRALARFAELQTNRPLYITKGTRLTALDQPVVNVDGYEISYSDASVITHYAVLVSGAGLAAIEKEYQHVQAADPASLKRPDRLHGLSPWSARSARPAPPETRVREIIAALDPRGAWVEDGSIGKADRLVSVFAGKEMVVTLGGKPMPMRENETLEVFLGAQPPKQRILKTRTFADNVEVLCAYLTGSAR